MARTSPYPADPEPLAFELVEGALPPPLQFDVSPGEDDYRAPRPGRWRRLRLALLVTLVTAALIAATWTAWSPILSAVSEGTATLAAREGDGQAQPTATIALGAAGLLMLVGAWWRGTHPRRPVRLSGERGRMAVDAIAGQLRAAILDQGAVRDADVAIENRGQGRVRVRAWLRVEPDARIDDVLDAVDDLADWLIHGRLGLVLAEPPLADVRYDELDLRATRPRGRPDDGDA